MQLCTRASGESAPEDRQKANFEVEIVKKTPYLYLSPPRMALNEAFLNAVIISFIIYEGLKNKSPSTSILFMRPVGA